MKENKVIIGTRESKLAMAQSGLVREYICRNHPGLHVELLPMKTTGDRILHRPLNQIGGKGLFVKELDWALQEGRSDLSVHSLKDLPMELPEGLPLLCVSPREDPRDVLVLPKGSTQWDKRKPVGSSSLRRTVQFQRLFPQVNCKSIRGNVLTRLEKLDAGEYGAIVLAAAGLKRLHLEERISRYFEIEEMLPAAGQGILAVQGREGEDYSYLQGYEEAETACAARAERAFVRHLGGGCSSPAAAYGKVTEGRLLLEGFYYREADDTCHRAKIRGNMEEAERLGEELARQIKSGL